jgi:hypothetical protein
MTNQSPNQADLRESIINILGVERGSDLPMGVNKTAPAAQHHYLAVEDYDYEKEEVIATVYVNFEEQIRGIEQLIEAYCLKRETAVFEAGYTKAHGDYYLGEIERAAQVNLLDDLNDVGEIHHSVYDYRLAALTTEEK